MRTTIPHYLNKYMPHLLPCNESRGSIAERVVEERSLAHSRKPHEICSKVPDTPCSRTGTRPPSPENSILLYTVPNECTAQTSRMETQKLSTSNAADPRSCQHSPVAGPACCQMEGWRDGGTAEELVSESGFSLCLSLYLSVWLAGWLES